MNIVVITGVSRGLGLVLAKTFAEADWTVVGTGRSERPAELPERVVYQQFDASDAAAGEAFWKQLASEYPDAAVCLVNNAGGYVGGGLVDTGTEDYAGQMQSCYFSAVYMTRGLALAVPKAKIINIVSSSALQPEKENVAYGAAKAAERYFFQALQDEFPAAQYQITNLYPSYIATDSPDDKAMTAEDVAQFVRGQAESTTSFYLRDVTMYPR
ncbi:MAG TPA: SDR family oxidoreductase [Candidatus Saccharimonadales bacterium]|nr:SDR family oxidoreductase [Candidatus Saccharimonadales bacterium]